MVDKLPFLPDEHHYAIAAVAARAAQLEATIETSISILLAATEKTSAFILKNMNGDKYVGLLKQMLLDLSPAREDIINKAFPRIAAARTERNEILHWLWGKSEKPSAAKYTSLRPHREQQERSKTAAEIQAVADELLELSLVISALVTLSAKLRPSPYTPGPTVLVADSTWQQMLDLFQSGQSLRRPPAPSQT